MKTDAFNEVGRALSGDDILSFSMLPVPSVSVDTRIGGVKAPGVDLPFDLGFSFFSFDFSSMLGADADLGIKWMNWGIDFRYLLMRQNGLIPDVSANVGFAQWSLDLNTENVDAKLSTNTVYFGGQASYTLSFFIPYLGIKMMTGKSKATTTITVDESKGNGLAADLRSRTFGPDKGFFQMQIFGGFGLDWLVFQTAIGASIDVVTGVPGLNFSTRFSL
jgi:hypothetical protein